MIFEHLTQEAWQDIHRDPTQFTASNTPVVMDLVKWRSKLRLFWQYMGVIPWPDVSIAMRHGHACEPLIEELYRELTGRDCWDPGDYTIIRHPKYKWLSCTLDRLESVPDTDSLQVERVVEFKTTGSYGASEWREGIPEYVLPQVDIQMEICGCEHASVAALIGGSEFVAYDVDRDQGRIDRAMEAILAFRENVEKQEPPEPDGTDDCAAVLKELAGEVKEDVTVELDAAALDIIHDVCVAESIIKHNKLLVAECKNKIRQMLGNATHGVVGGKVVVTNKSKKNGVRCLVMKGD